MTGNIEKGSILHYLCMMGILFVMVVILIFAGLYSTTTKQTEEHEILLDYLVQVNGLLSKLYELKNGVTVLHGEAWSEELIVDHIAMSQLLDAAIDDFEERYELSEYTSNILRRLKGINQFQLELLEFPQDAASFYFNTMYVQEALDAHIGEFYHLIRYEQAESLNIYTEREQVTFQHANMLISILLLCIMFAFIAYTRFALSLRGSIKKTIENLHRIGKHEWEVEDLSETEDYSEFIELATEVNHEKKELETYFREQEKRRELEVRLMEKERNAERTKQLLVSTEMDMLKSQINPHFIFNSLHQIGMATLLKEPEDVLKMVEYTGNILRYSLYNKDSLVELDEELFVVRQYIGLLQVCNPESVVLEIRDETLADGLPKRILPMCLQPIVENSVKHGCKDDETLNITIRIEETDSSLIVSITDDGEGIDDVTHVLDKSTKSIGLKNISRRLSLVYGRDDLMKIESEKGRYTTIILEFPMDGGEENARSDS